MHVPDIPSKHSLFLAASNSAQAYAHWLVPEEVKHNEPFRWVGGCLELIDKELEGGGEELRVGQDGQARVHFHCSQFSDANPLSSRWQTSLVLFPLPESGTGARFGTWPMLYHLEMCDGPIS